MMAGTVASALSGVGIRSSRCWTCSRSIQRFSSTLRIGETGHHHVPFLLVLRKERTAYELLALDSSL